MTKANQKQYVNKRTVNSHFERCARVRHQLEAVGADDSTVARRVVVNGAARVGNWREKSQTFGATRYDCRKRNCIRREKQITRAIPTQISTSSYSLNVSLETNPNRDKR